jgi:coatomer subunit beta'
MLEEALEIATDADYKFDLAVQLGKLEIAKVHSTLSCVLLSLYREHCCNVFDAAKLLNFWTLFFVQDIAVEAQSESKWKQLGELAMSTGKVGS